MKIIKASSNDIEKTISTIRDSFVGSQQVYTNGSCYHFYLILKSIYTWAEPYYDGEHVITKLDGKYYDITGEIAKPNGASKYEQVPMYGLKTPFNIYTYNK